MIGSENESMTSNLYELVLACYSHVAPKDADHHYKRILNFTNDNFIPAGKAILNRPSDIKFSDLFCGAGGLSLGFELEGAVCEFSIDYDQSSIESYSINRPDASHAVCGDIRNYLKSSTYISSVPLVIGGPPCQGFSLANQQPQKNDPRNLLYESFLEYAHRAKARVIVIENVPGILKYWSRIYADLQRHGYESCIIDIEASKLGVPQKRRRVFIIGVSELSSKNSQHFFDKINTSIAVQIKKSINRNISDALYGMPSLVAKSVKNRTDHEDEYTGHTISSPAITSNEYIDTINREFGIGPLFNHRTKYNNERDIELFSCLMPGEDTTSELFSKLNPYKNRDHIFKDKFFRLHPEQPSKTITAHMYYDCHMYIHPSQDRGLTPREAARIQGFPDQYIFLGKPNEWYRQIGNAVSPLVSRCLAKALLPSIREFI
ncbi:MAG: DNA cytosine methyltransferase [Desulfuromonadaceae bacterium]|nr:DNA cytosine methyltransferase [Desulfuromonadaceae bacterium]